MLVVSDMEISEDIACTFWNEALEYSISHRLIRDRVPRICD